MRTLIKELLEQYETGFLDTDSYDKSWDYDYQKDCLLKMMKLMAEHTDYLHRSNHFAHFTASALVVSEDEKSVVLLHHKKLNKWLQPGGHADGEEDLTEVALKEVREETGLKDLEVKKDENGEAFVFDLDIHEIPARKTDPDHYHYDVRFLIKVTGDHTLVQNHESNELKWLELSEARKLTDEKYCSHVR